MILDKILPKRFTIEEYFDFEEKSLEKHEFNNGKIVKMAGASYNHNKIVANVITALSIALENRIECTVLPSDIKIHVPKIRQFIYPDAVVICEEPMFYEGRTDTIINPLLVVEVLSDGTADYDRGGKFLKYRMIPSFKEYVLISQDAHFVSSFYQTEPRTWKETISENVLQNIHLQSLNIEISLARIYKGVILEI